MFLERGVCYNQLVLLTSLLAFSRLHFVLQDQTCLLFWLSLDFLGFPSGSDGKESACNTGDPGSVTGWGDPLDKEMVTHSSVLAWKILWTEEPGRLPFMGSQRVRHD